MKTKNNPERYETPEINVFEMEVEAGIANSEVSGTSGRAPFLNFSQDDDIYM